MALPDWFDRMGGLTRIDGGLHRSPLPYTEAHFATLRTAGIRVIYSMEEAVPGPLALKHGFDWRPHFWTDDVPPTVDQMDHFLADYLAHPPEAPVLVHCKAGWGRTGSAVACGLAARHGWSAKQALEHFWGRVPQARSIMNRNGQTDFVYGYVARRHGRGIA